MSNDIRTATLLKLADHMKSINKTLTELNKEVEEMMQDIMRDLREETKGADEVWIPCSERNPEKNGEYLITLGFEWGREIEMGFYEDGEWLNDNRHVNIAWKPLPEPWKGADDE